MGRSQRDMQSVVLVEADAAGAPAVADRDDHPGPLAEEPADRGPGSAHLAAARTWALRRWWPVAAALVLVVGTGALVSDRREAARVAALAGIPGFLSPLDGPVAELWRARDEQYIGLSVLGNLVLGVAYQTDGTTDVVGLDALSGAVTWRTPVLSGRSDVNTGWTSCVLPARRGPGEPTAENAVAACIVVDTSETVAGSDYGATFPTAARLLLIDAYDGAVRAEQDVAASTSVSTLGADLLISYVDADGRAHVRRTDALASTDRWTFTSPERVPADDDQYPQLQTVVNDDVVLANASVFSSSGGNSTGTSWALAGATGALLHTEEDAAGGWVDVATGGSTLLTPVSADPSSGTRVVDVASGRAFTADAVATWMAADDRSLPGLLVMQSLSGADLVAYELATGTPRWTVRADGANGTVVVDGRIIRAGSKEITAIDGRTGKAVWTTPLQQPGSAGYQYGGPGGSLATDGRLVLLTRPDGGGQVLAAYGLDDGRERWTVPVDQSLYLTPVEGRLFGWSQNGYVAFG
ncbi:MAG: PQQ-binding-like beta-propeller repeat protein [Cellulomonas sp.]